MFKKVLVANRGEIACRIIRALREAGVPSVAVYSEADALALHLRLADEAFSIGGAPASASYLNAKAILDAAGRSGADAIHPGYGFLSENAEFAEACAEQDIAFIGPSPRVIRTMGSKTEARQLMIDAGVPVVPGTTSPLEDEASAIKTAAEVGYPVLLKAVAGGGGKGMRLVGREEDLMPSLAAAKREARSAFGDDRVYLEKAIVGPRHIEIQVLADSAGHTVHLFERECSVQRRHQKVIEETPAMGLPSALRDEMGRVAVRGAQAIGYEGAGTFEFLLDKEQNFYFLEMNTRLQVEHPITELVTGVDLCALQIRIAAGEDLPFCQEELSQRGHAIECRIYAEDPVKDFAPSPGRLLRYRPPVGAGVRVDDGVREGDEIPVHYDPMIAKLCVWASSRSEALARAERALGEYAVAGIQHNIDFLRWVLKSAAFSKGEYDTSLLETLGPYQQAVPPEESRVHLILAACVAHMNQEAKGGGDATTGLSRVPSAWRRALDDHGGLR
jgi:acetyl-CoA carboxylase biotin carboxylase subunit